MKGDIDWKKEALPIIYNNFLTNGTADVLDTSAEITSPAIEEEKYTCDNCKKKATLHSELAPYIKIARAEPFQKVDIINALNCLYTCNDGCRAILQSVVAILQSNISNPVSDSAIKSITSISISIELLDQQTRDSVLNGTTPRTFHLNGPFLGVDEASFTPKEDIPKETAFLRKLTPDEKLSRETGIRAEYDGRDYSGGNASQQELDEKEMIKRLEALDSEGISVPYNDPIFKLVLSEIRVVVGEKVWEIPAAPSGINSMSPQTTQETKRAPELLLKQTLMHEIGGHFLASLERVHYVYMQLKLEQWMLDYIDFHSKNEEPKPDDKEERKEWRNRRNEIREKVSRYRETMKLGKGHSKYSYEGDKAKSVSECA